MMNRGFGNRGRRGGGRQQQQQKAPRYFQQNQLFQRRANRNDRSMQFEQQQQLQNQNDEQFDFISLQQMQRQNEEQFGFRQQPQPFRQNQNEQQFGFNLQQQQQQLQNENDKLVFLQQQELLRRQIQNEQRFGFRSQQQQRQNQNEQQFNYLPPHKQQRQTQNEQFNFLQPQQQQQRRFDRFSMQNQRNVRGKFDNRNQSNFKSGIPFEQKRINPTSRNYQASSKWNPFSQSMRKILSRTMRKRNFDEMDDYDMNPVETVDLSIDEDSEEPEIELDLNAKKALVMRAYGTSVNLLMDENREKQKKRAAENRAANDLINLMFGDVEDEREPPTAPPPPPPPTGESTRVEETVEAAPQTTTTAVGEVQTDISGNATDTPNCSAAILQKHLRLTKELLSTLQKSIRNRITHEVVVADGVITIESEEENETEPSSGNPRTAEDCLKPCTGIYCTVCRLFFLDETAARDHLSLPRHERAAIAESSGRKRRRLDATGAVVVVGTSAAAAATAAGDGGVDAGTASGTTTTSTTATTDGGNKET